MGFAFNINKVAVCLVLAVTLSKADSLFEALQSRRYQDALALTDTLLARQPDEPKILTARGIALGGLGRERESIAAFEKALQLAPRFLPALQGVTEVCYRTRDSRTTGFLSRLIDLSPENGTAQAMAGVLAFDEGKCANAIQHFEAGLKETVNNDRAYPLYGTCLLKAGRPLEAVQVFEALLARHPANPTNLLNSLAAAEVAAHRYESAAAHLHQAIRTAPAHERNYVDLAALEIQLEALDAALQVVSEGLKTLPGSARLHSLLGVIHAQAGRVEEAALDFNLANRLDAKQEFGAAGLGLLYTETKQTDLAVSVLRTRLKKDPNDAMLNYLLAQAILDGPVASGSAEFQEARQALTKSLAVRPDMFRTHTLLGKLYSHVGENDKALEELEIATRRDRRDRTALSQLAIVLRRLGRTTEAASVVAELRQLLLSGAP